MTSDAPTGREASASNSTGYTPRPVSGLFHYDWNFIQKAVPLKVMTPVSFVVSAAPLYADFLSHWFGTQIGLTLVWMASVCFLLAMAFYAFGCPRFIKQYSCFTDYLDYGHSHRWIVWEFYNSISEPKRWHALTGELQAKGFLKGVSKVPLSAKQRAIAFGVDRAKDFQPGVSTSFTTWVFNLLDRSPKTVRQRIQEKGLVWRLNLGHCKDYQCDPIKTFQPLNIGLDIALPIERPDKKFFLYVSHQQDNIELAQKELFWILFTEAARLNDRARTIFWVLFYIAAALYSFGIIVNIARVVF